MRGCGSFTWLVFNCELLSLITSHPLKPVSYRPSFTRRAIAVFVIVDLLMMVPAIFLFKSFELPSLKTGLAALGDANTVFLLGAVDISVCALTPMVAISLRNRSKGSHEYWPSNLAEKYAPKDFSMARRGGSRVTVFNLDDQEIAASYSMFPRWGRRVEIDDHCYQITFEKAYDRERPF